MALAVVLGLVVGIAGVVAALVGLLAMGGGFRTAMERSGDPSRAIVLRGGSTVEPSSGLNKVIGEPGCFLSQANTLATVITTFDFAVSVTAYDRPPHRWRPIDRFGT